MHVDSIMLYALSFMAPWTVTARSELRRRRFPIDGLKSALSYAWRLGIRSSNVQAHVLRGSSSILFASSFFDAGPTATRGRTKYDHITWVGDYALRTVDVGFLKMEKCRKYFHMSCAPVMTWVRCGIFGVIPGVKLKHGHRQPECETIFFLSEALDHAINPSSMCFSVVSRRGKLIMIAWSIRNDRHNLQYKPEFYATW